MPADNSPSRRQTPTERLYDVAMAAITRRPTEPEHTVEISRNARGIVQLGLTVKGSDLDALIEAATAHFGALDTKYPYPAQNGGGE